MTDRSAARGFLTTRHCGVPWAGWVACVFALHGFRIAEARAADPASPCEAARLEVDEHIDPVWLDALATACEGLKRIPDVDPMAHVRVAPGTEGVLVEVRLTDGRAALRRVRSPSDLARTLEALLTVPPPAVLARAPDLVKAQPIDHTAHPSAAAPVRADASKESEIRMDVGAMLGVRLARPPSYGSFGPAGFASLRMRSWLLDVSMRWEAIQRPMKSSYGNLDMQTLAASVNVGRRVLAGRAALDVGLGPSFVVQSQSLEVANDEKAGSTSDLRLGGLVRMTLGASRIRWVVGLDADVSPWGARRPTRLDEALPTLPSWSVGVGMGAAWADR
ncbi:MAG: hypothetical protein HY898_05500 [Deltaproteobacteria bacterium]|nr:hypothetical protein [Deltaproteobacteria bacterium]